jgi:hypothetical protein
MQGHVLFAGAWDDGPGYPRARSLRAGLEACGLEVRECRLAEGVVAITSPACPARREAAP